jgi:hypothetical protein
VRTGTSCCCCPRPPSRTDPWCRET